MAHSYNEVELTNKGRKALEDGDIEIPSQLPQTAKIAMMAIIAMARHGHSVSDMVEDFAQHSHMDIQSADSLFESIVAYLVSTGYLRYIEDFEDEEPPEAFSDFKDYF